MDDFCTFVLEGDHPGTYYVPCDRLEDITKDGLINTGSSTIYLYTSPRTNSNESYITLRTLYHPYWNDSRGTSYSGYFTNARIVSYNSYANYRREYDLVSFVLLFLVAFSLLIRVFMKRSRR